MKSASFAAVFLGLGLGFTLSANGCSSDTTTVTSSANDAAAGALQADAGADTTLDDASVDLDSGTVTVSNDAPDIEIDAGPTPMPACLDASSPCPVPASVCLDSKTLRFYEGDGTCGDGGLCVFTSRDIACDPGPSGPACTNGGCPYEVVR